MKLLEGENENKMKGKTMETILFVGSCVLVLATGFLVFNKDGNKTTTAISLDDIWARQTKLMESNKTFADTTIKMLADLNTRVGTIESEGHKIDLHLREPIRVSIVREKNNLIKPEAPLLKRAGLLPKENN